MSSTVESIRRKSSDYQIAVSAKLWTEGSDKKWRSGQINAEHERWMSEGGRQRDKEVIVEEAEESEVDEDKGGEE